MKLLTPDPAEQLLPAMRAAREIAESSNHLMQLVSEVEDNLVRLQQQGQKAEKLDYCVRRVQEIHQALNGIELGAFFGISVKNTCEELWRKMP